MKTVARGVLLLAASGLMWGPVGCKSGGGPSRRAAASPETMTTVERSRVREAAISALLEMTQSEDPQVRANAIEGLLPASARLGAVLPGALADPNEGVRTVAATVVGKARLTDLAGAVEPLTSETSGFVRGAAIFALRRCGVAVDPSPLGAMVTGDPSPRVRAQAAYLLGELGDKGTSAMLREAVQLQVPRANPTEMKVLSLQVAEALVKLGDDEQLGTIRAALYPSTADELDATVLAAQVLGELRDRGSEGQLRNLAAMRDPAGRPMPIEVRLAVIGALGSMGAEAPVGDALDALASGPAPVQMQAAWALGQVGSPGAIRALEAWLGSGSGGGAGPGSTPERVRVAVAAALLQATR